jgi:prophage tail gpP-like protein
MDEFELLVGGMVYAGWTSIGVTRAMDASAGAFTVTLAERWYEGQSPRLTEPWPILPGDECEVKLGGVSLIKGYVDIFRPSFSSNSHTINIQGRDKTADLIDCSSVHNPDQWKNLDVLQFAQALAKPYGVKVRADVDVGPKFATLKLQQGETSFEAIERYAKQRKLLLMPDTGGDLLLTRAGTKRAAVSLVQGENILEASGSIDHTQRFSEYIVKAQASYSNDTDGDREAHLKGSVTDSGIERYRPMLIIAEAGGTGASVTERAAWEANTRIGKSAAASITVQGWRQQPGGALWEPNMLVPVRSSWLRMDGEMIIRQVTYERGEGGTTAKLDIVSPQAFAPEPPDSKDAKTRKAGKRNVWAEAIGEEDAPE